jgi:hypothetical protein
MRPYVRPLAIVTGTAALLMAVTVTWAFAQVTAPTKPLAEVNGQPITEEEIDKAIASQLAKLQE